MRAVLSWTIFPGVLGGALASAWVGMQLGIPHGALTTGILIGFGGLLLLLQRWHPHRRDWATGPGEYGLDLLHGLFSTGGSSFLFGAIAFGLLVSGGSHLSEGLGVTLWPSELALPIQLALSLVIGELGQYTVHRLSHEVPLLWRIHALHHSSERLYMLSAGRNHPFSNVLSYGANISVLVFLGAPAELLLMQSVFTGVHGFLQHANVEMRFGPLNWVFATADYHRWHHSSRPEEGNANYGSNLIVLDRLLGTRQLPADRQVEEVGLHEMPSFPRDFLGQLASPFTWTRLTEPPEPR
jgi:sterol desaturase/sphingolipid hydroxylase (fatty acid hydroxylase superfamily)